MGYREEKDYMSIFPMDCLSLLDSITVDVIVVGIDRIDLQTI
jgi:hypothetical protein